MRVDDGGFSRLYPTRDVQSFCLPLLSLLFSRDFRRWWSYWRRGPGLLRWLPWSLESVGVVAFRVLPPPARPAAGSFRCYRLYDGLVVMLVTGSMAILVLGVPWRNCAGQLGFFFFRGRWELLGEMGCGGGPWVLALLSTEALIFYYKEKNSNRDLEEGRDRRRLKLLTLTGNFLWFS